MFLRDEKILKGVAANMHEINASYVQYSSTYYNIHIINYNKNKLHSIRVIYETDLLIRINSAGSRILVTRTRTRQLEIEKKY